MPNDCLISTKPANLTYAEAATVPTRAMLALSVLNESGIASGARVLIYGASGGVGTFAVQLAKHFGAEVTGACSAANAELIRSLGADRVLDYAREDQPVDGPYDIIFDAVGGKKNSPLKSRLAAALRPGGRSLSVDRIAKIPAALLDEVTDLIAAGKIRPVLDRAYPLAETAEAHRYAEAGHKRGGVAIEVATSDSGVARS